MCSKKMPSAYPVHGSMGEVVQEGMTLRDSFAAHAMQGLLAGGWTHLLSWRPTLSTMAYTLADDMLKEREKERGK